MIYANNAGTCWPRPASVGQAAADALAAEPEARQEIFDSSHAAISDFLGVEDPSRLLLTPGCTAALSIALQDLPWSAGDVLLTSSLEHHAMMRPVSQLVRDRGVVHRAAPYRPGAPVDLDWVRDQLGAGGVRAIAMTAASNVTGELLPVHSLARLAREHGVVFLLDAAQTVGLMPMDFRDLGADIVTFAGHKMSLGPQGIGGLWAAPGVVFASPSARCEIGPGERMSCGSFPGYCDAGSVNLAGAAGLAASMGWIAARGIAQVGGTARALAGLLLEEFAEREHLLVLGAADAERTGVVSLRIPGLPLERAESFFRERGILVRAGQHCAPMALQALGVPEGTLRVSLGPFNGEDDVACILAAVDEAAGPGSLS